MENTIAQVTLHEAKADTPTTVEVPAGSFALVFHSGNLVDGAPNVKADGECKSLKIADRVDVLTSKGVRVQANAFRSLPKSDPRRK